MANKIVIFSGPSGVGKATIEDKLFADTKFNFGFSISATTRNPREGEKDGEDYYFLSHEVFNSKIDNNEFLEWNEHFSNRYGTLKSELTRLLNEDKTPFLEIEVVGALNVMKQFDADKVISFFVTAPSKDELRQRILARSTENSMQLEERLSRVDEELSYAKYFNYVIVNDDVSRAVEEIKNILIKENINEVCN